MKAGIFIAIHDFQNMLRLYHKLSAEQEASLGVQQLYRAGVG